MEDHFDTAYELETELELAGKQHLLSVARSIAPDDMLCTYVRQPRALGLGHAVLCAKELVAGEPFAVLLADDLMVGETPIMAQMVRQFAHWRRSILAVQDVPREHTNRYGIVSGSSVAPDVVDLTGIVEKPSPEQAPSTLAVAGRYILTPGIFHELENIPRGVGGEIQLTDGGSGRPAPRSRGRIFGLASRAILKPVASGGHAPCVGDGACASALIACQTAPDSGRWPDQRLSIFSACMAATRPSSVGMTHTSAVLAGL